MMSRMVRGYLRIIVGGVRGVGVGRMIGFSKTFAVAGWETAELIMV